MLQHEQSSEETMASAQIRVTPEELARAIASLEARLAEEARLREEEAQRNSGMLSLHEAVDNLSLQFSEDQLWEEVKKQRAEDAAIEKADTLDTHDSSLTASVPVLHKPEEEPTEQIPKTAGTWNTNLHSETHFFTGLLIICLVIVVGLIGLVVSYQSGVDRVNPQPVPPVLQIYHSSPMPSAPSPTEELDTDFYNKLRQSQGPYPLYHIVQVSLFPPHVPQLSGGQLYPTRAIPDGYSVYMNGVPFDFQRFIRGPDYSSAVFFQRIGDTEPIYANPAEIPNRTIITTRYDGRRYLRCWTARNQIQAFKSGGPVSLFTSADALEVSQEQELVPITIPMEPVSFGEEPVNASLLAALTRLDQDNANSITLPDASQLSLDDHAWENFPVRVLPDYTAPAWAKNPGVFFGNFASPTYVRYSDFDASSIVESVGDVPNNRPFHTGRIFLEQIAVPAYETLPPGANRRLSTPLPDILVDVRKNLHQPYTFIKINGYLYLQGWVAAKMSEEKMRGHNIDVYNDSTEPELGYSPTQIRLRVDHCRLLLSFNPRYLTITDVHLDQHAWEKW